MKRKASSKKIKIGVVGCGYWGPNLIRNFVQVPNVELKAVCDIDKLRVARMKTLYPFLETTTDYNLLLAKNIDAVVIATPTKTHYGMAKKALLKGKHVLVEKPFVLNSAQAKELVSLAHKRKLTLMVDHTFVYSAALKKIRQLIKKGQLGEIYTVDMQRVGLGIVQDDHNVILDLLPHDLSILLYTLDVMPKSVIAVGEAHIHNNIEDTAHVLLKFPKRTLASVHLSWLSPLKIRRATFVGSKKMLFFDDLEATDKIKIFDKGITVRSVRAPQMKFYESFAEFTYLYRSGDTHIPYLDQTEPLKMVAEEYVASLREGRKPLSAGEEGLKITKIIEASQESLRKGGKEVQIK